MISFPNLRVAALSIATIIALVTAGAASAQASTPIGFVLDWKLQGVHAWFHVAQERCRFAQEKLDVTIHQGDGSAAAMNKVMVYLLHNRTPFALMTKASRPIKALKDLEGKNLGSPAGGAAYRMFGLLAEKNGVDASKVSWTNMAPNLQEQTLLRGQVDASAMFSVTSYMNLAAQGIDPDKDIRWFHCADYGIDLYSNGVLVSQALLKDKPEAVAGLVRAIHHGVRDTLADPDAAIDVLAKREPLLNKALEKRRLLYTSRSVMLTPEVAAIGIGDVKDDRLGRSVEQLATAFELAAKPKPGDVFDRHFLPPLAERQLTLK